MHPEDRLQRFFTFVHRHRTGPQVIAAGCPDEVLAFAEGMLTEVRWRLDPIFMLDVCESAERFWLV